jgi:DNA-binding XRE family transcriptional regulator
VVSAEDTQRRIRAARVLAGMERVDDLADKINTRGLGRDTLYNIEAGRRRVQPHELRLIAEATRVSPAFFEVDFSTLGQPGAEFADRVRAIEEQLAAYDARLEDHIAGVQTQLAAYGRRLAALKPPEESVYPSPPGELGRDATDSQPSPEHHAQDESRRVAETRPTDG